MNKFYCFGDRGRRWTEMCNRTRSFFQIYGELDFQKHTIPFSFKLSTVSSKLCRSEMYSIPRFFAFSFETLHLGTKGPLSARLQQRPHSHASKTNGCNHCHSIIMSNSLSREEERRVKLPQDLYDFRHVSGALDEAVSSTCWWRLKCFHVSVRDVLDVDPSGR